MLSVVNFAITPSYTMSQKKSFWSIPPLPPIQLNEFIMGYAVLHTEKGKTSSGGIGNHIDRKKGKEHTYKHADPNRLNLNQNFKVPGNRHKMELSDAIQDRLDSGYNGKRKIRTDAVKYTTHILTGSHEDMIKIFADQKKKDQWIKANYNFLKKEFGKDNIVRFTLHLDEKTPHIHAVTVPLTADGRLSAREVLGNPKAFKARQDRYAKAMKPFGLKRGVKDTGIKHEGAREYYKRINIENEQEIKKPKTFLNIVSPIDLQRQTDTLKSLKNEFKQIETEKQRYLKRNAELYKQLEQEKEKNQKYYNNPKAFVEAVNEEKKQNRALANIDFAEAIADYILRNPDEIDHKKASKDKNFILDSMFDFHTDTKSLDKDFIRENWDYIMEIDQKSGSGFKNSLDQLQKMSIRKQKEKEQWEKRVKELKEKEQNREQERRKNKGLRR